MPAESAGCEALRAEQTTDGIRGDCRGRGASSTTNSSLDGNPMQTLLTETLKAGAPN